MKNNEFLKVIVVFNCMIGSIFLPQFILEGITYLFNYEFSFGTGLFIILYLMCMFLFATAVLIKKFDKNK